MAVVPAESRERLWPNDSPVTSVSVGENCPVWTYGSTVSG